MLTVFPRASNDVQHWLSACRRHVCAHGTTIKVAELGGDGQDVPFEQAFSNLAHAYLRDKAPTLLDHELGFQLLDRNQDNTKAVGVFAFKVGSQMLLAPAFFLSGDLKGHELLYLKDQDMFVPMKENWLNYILNRRPNILGAGVSRQTAQLGVMQPDLNRLSQSPYKYASSVLPEVQEFMPVYAHLTAGHLKQALNDYHSHCAARLDLSHFIKQAGLPMLQVMVNMFQRKPKIAQAFDKWYGLQTLNEAIKEAGVRLRTQSILDDPYKMVSKYQATLTSGSVLDAMEKQAAKDDDGPDVKNKVKIITWDQSRTDVPEGLDEKDQEKLLNDEVLIKDHRAGDEVSVAYKTDTENRLSNPSETGLYMVLTKPGDFEKCLIVVDPHGPDGRKHFVTIVRLNEGMRSWGNYPRNDVWVAGLIEELIPGGEESWNKFYEDLPTVESLSKDDGRYMLVGPRRNATCPFRVKKSIGGGDDKSYDIDMADQCSDSHRLAMRMAGPDRQDGYDSYNPFYDGCRVHLDAKQGTDLRSSNGDIFIPSGYRVLRLESSKRDDQRKKEPAYDFSASDDRESDTPPIMPGKIIDAEMSIMKKTAALKIAYTGDSYCVNGQSPLKRREAVIHLVREHGFRQSTSEIMLKEAEVAHRRSGSAWDCRVKYALPHLTDQGPSAPSFPEAQMGGWNPMGFQGQTIDGGAQEMVVPELMGSNTDPSIYNVNPANTPDPMDMQAVGQAANSGQKEIFDTSMIGSMLKAVRDDTMIDRYIPDLVKGMDRLGRLLFMFYWHQDRFSERYGKQDLPELEDSLRNAFEMMGDVILFLKQKTIEPYPEEAMRDLDLGSAAQI